MPILKMSVLVFFVCVSFAASAACLLADYSVTAEYSRSIDVIVGVVVNRESAAPSGGYFDGLDYTVSVDRIYKGRLPEQVSVFSENSSGRFPMEVGAKYLLFVHEEQGRYMVDNCGNSGLLLEKAQVLNSLRGIAANEPGERKVRERKIIKDEHGLVERNSVNSVHMLLHQARTYGSIRLRVVFATEFTTRDSLTVSEYKQHNEGIRKSIISDLGPRLIKEDRSNYPGLPWITLTVDAIGLQQLISDPRVIYIESIDLSDLSREELQELLDKTYSSSLIISPSEVLMSAIGRKRTLRLQLRMNLGGVISGDFIQSLSDPSFDLSLNGSGV